MLLSTEMLLPTGPPPQAVLNQRWLWQVLLVLLGLTLTFRLIGLDIAGALLSGLMLCFVVIMIRDGMRELAKYALVYAVLCGLNFFFDILPLITEIGGRITRTAQPGSGLAAEDGLRQETYTLTTKITPFFSWNEGLMYNAQSLSMILSPICMALGAYLSIVAHTEIQEQTQTFFDDDLEGFIHSLPRHPALAGGGPGSQGGGEAEQNGAGRQGGHSRGFSARATFERFSGTPHKL